MVGIEVPRTRILRFRWPHDARSTDRVAVGSSSLAGVCGRWACDGAHTVVGRTSKVVGRADKQATCGIRLIELG